MNEENEGQGRAERKPIAVPYKDMAAAVKDAFKKFGGPEKAFTLLVRGFKTVEWRKRTDRAARERAKAEDAAEVVQAVPPPVFRTTVPKKR
jgi:hypothetical protein